MNQWDSEFNDKNEIVESKLMEKFYEYLKIHKDLERKRNTINEKKQKKRKYAILALIEGTILVGLTVSFLFLISG